LEQRARAFESFTRKAEGIGSAFSGPADVNRALDVGAGHDPRQLEAGLIAYAALAALQEPKFVAGVQGAARTGKARSDLANQVAARPQSALDLPGGRLAAGRATAALLRQASPLVQSGRQVKQTSYSVQHQAWSKASVAGAPARLARVKQISLAGYRPGPDDAAQLRKAVAEDGRQGAGASPVVARGLAVAALTVLGQDVQARALLTEPSSGLCLKIAKLNLFQCLASAGPYYEDIFCLAEHAMIEPGQCVVTAANRNGPQQRADAGR
jgi:hypothetical protein